MASLDIDLDHRITSESCILDVAHYLRLTQHHDKDRLRSCASCWKACGYWVTAPCRLSGALAGPFHVFRFMHMAVHRCHCFLSSTDVDVYLHLGDRVSVAI